MQISKETSKKESVDFYVTMYVTMEMKECVARLADGMALVLLWAYHIKIIFHLENTYASTIFYNHSQLSKFLIVFFFKNKVTMFNFLSSLLFLKLSYFLIRLQLEQHLWEGQSRYIFPFSVLIFQRKSLHGYT